MIKVSEITKKLSLKVFGIFKMADYFLMSCEINFIWGRQKRILNKFKKTDDFFK